MDTRVLTAHVPVALAEQVDAAAVRLEWSRGWIVKQALMAWLKQEGEQMRLAERLEAEKGTALSNVDSLVEALRASSFGPTKS